MTAAKILALVILIAIPVLTALLGFSRMKAPRPLGVRGGYRSERSMISQSAWSFAQRINGIYYLFGGAAMAVASVSLTLILPQDIAMMEAVIYALVFAAAWVVFNLVLMVLTEAALIRKHFTC